MNNKYYVIKESDLMDLLYSAYMLTALNKGKVDEWSKYTQSIFNFENENGAIEDLIYEELKTYNSFEI